MSMQDPISDMLTIIRNGQMARKQFVLIPLSKMKHALAKVLHDEGYIAGYEVIDENKNKPELRIELKYYQNKPVISSITRASRPGLRRYKNCKTLPRIMGGLGIAIISTSKGLMTDHAARAAGVGGEVICYVE